MFYIFAPTKAVVLPSEDIGNGDNMQASLITHRTLNGQLSTYKRVDSHNSKAYSFSSVKNEVYTKLVTLILESAGRVLILEDSKGITFTARLSPASVSMTSERESGGILYRSFELNFKGAANA